MRKSILKVVTVDKNEGTSSEERTSSISKTEAEQPAEKEQLKTRFTLPESEAPTPSSVKNLLSRQCVKFLRFVYFHGSIIGPAPCSFLFLCSCSTCCTEKCLGPLNRASFATRLMYIIFLAFVNFFATFFIIAYPNSEKNKGVAGLKPCVRPNGSFYEINGFYKNCRGHAGYFIVYRIFLAMIIMFFVLAFFTIGVVTTRERCRPGIHQGFWLFKFLIFFVLVMFTLLTINLSNNALFDETMMICALVSTAVFSVVQLVLFLDMIDILVMKLKNKVTKQLWYNLIYWTATMLVYSADLGLLALMWKHYTHRSTGMSDQNPISSPANYGIDDLCQTNKRLIYYCGSVGIVVTLAMIYQSVSKIKTYPNLGLMQSAFIFGLTLIYVHGALGNSVDLECRLVVFPFTYNKNSEDEAVTLEGLIHSVLVWGTIIYFALTNAPVSETAPWSDAIRLICCIKKAADEETKIELTFTKSQSEIQEEKKRFLLLKDEDKALLYSWPLFYVFLILGSLSLMMGMTNFFHPRADGPNAASRPAFICKLIMSAIAVLGFLVPVFVSWAQHWTDIYSRPIDNDNINVLKSPSRPKIEKSEIQILFRGTSSDDEIDIETQAKSSLVINNVVSMKSSIIAERNRPLELI